MEKFYEMGTVFKSENSDFTSFGFAERDAGGKIAFYLLSSKLPSFKVMELEEIKKVHEAFKTAGSYREIDKVMGVKQRYVTEENAEFIDKMCGLTIA